MAQQPQDFDLEYQQVEQKTQQVLERLQAGNLSPESMEQGKQILRGLVARARELQGLRKAVTQPQMGTLERESKGAMYGIGPGLVSGAAGLVEGIAKLPTEATRNIAILASNDPELAAVNRAMDPLERERERLVLKRAGPGLRASDALAAPTGKAVSGLNAQEEAQFAALEAQLAPLRQRRAKAENRIAGISSQAAIPGTQPLSQVMPTIARGAQSVRETMEGFVPEPVRESVTYQAGQGLGQVLAAAPAGPGALPLMMASSAGSGMEEARLSGASPGEALVYGAGGGLIEGATEKFGLGGRLPGYLSGAIKGRGMLRTGIREAVSEFPEEVAAYVGQTGLRQATFDPSAEITLEGALKAGTIGAVAGFGAGAAAGKLTTPAPGERDTLYTKAEQYRQERRRAEMEPGYVRPSAAPDLQSVQAFDDFRRGRIDEYETLRSQDPSLPALNADSIRLERAETDDELRLEGLARELNTRIVWVNQPQTLGDATVSGAFSGDKNIIVLQKGASAESLQSQARAILFHELVHKVNSSDLNRAYDMIAKLDPEGLAGVIAKRAGASENADEAAAYYAEGIANFLDANLRDSKFDQRLLEENDLLDWLHDRAVSLYNRFAEKRMLTAEQKRARDFLTGIGVASSDNPSLLDTRKKAQAARGVVEMLRTLTDAGQYESTPLTEGPELSPRARQVQSYLNELDRRIAAVQEQPRQMYTDKLLAYLSEQRDAMQAELQRLAGPTAEEEVISRMQRTTGQAARQQAIDRNRASTLVDQMVESVNRAIDAQRGQDLAEAEKDKARFDALNQEAARLSGLAVAELEKTSVGKSTRNQLLAQANKLDNEFRKKKLGGVSQYVYPRLAVTPIPKRPTAYTPVDIYPPSTESPTGTSRAEPYTEAEWIERNALTTESLVQQLKRQFELDIAKRTRAKRMATEQAQAAQRAAAQEKAARAEAKRLVEEAKAVTKRLAEEATKAAQEAASRTPEALEAARQQRQQEYSKALMSLRKRLLEIGRQVAKNNEAGKDSSKLLAEAAGIEQQLMESAGRAVQRMLQLEQVNKNLKQREKEQRNLKRLLNVISKTVMTPEAKTWMEEQQRSYQEAQAKTQYSEAEFKASQELGKVFERAAAERPYQGPEILPQSAPQEGIVVPFTVATQAVVEPQPTAAPQPPAQSSQPSATPAETPVEQKAKPKTKKQAAGRQRLEQEQPSNEPLPDVRPMNASQLASAVKTSNRYSFAKTLLEYGYATDGTMALLLEGKKRTDLESRVSQAAQKSSAPSINLDQFFEATDQGGIAQLVAVRPDQNIKDAQWAGPVHIYEGLNQYGKPKAIYVDAVRDVTIRRTHPEAQVYVSSRDDVLLYIANGKKVGLLMGRTPNMWTRPETKVSYVHGQKPTTPQPPAKQPKKKDGGIKYSRPDGRASAAVAFAGGGTVEIALADRVAAEVSVEYDADIAQAYNANAETAATVSDIMDADIDQFVGKDFAHFSPPCVASSKLQAGKEVDRETETKLGNTVAEIIRLARNPVVLIENVPQYKATQAFKAIEQALQDVGYNYDARIYKAEDYGSPSARSRLMVRAVLGRDLPPVPQRTHGSGTQQPHVSWMDAIGDMLDTLPVMHQSGTQLPEYIQKALSRRGVNPARPGKAYYIPGTQIFRDVPIKDSSSPAPTMLASEKETPRILMPDGRVLRVTPEAMRALMGFGTEMKLPDNDRLAKRIIGNGVPKPLTRAVALPMLDGETAPQPRQEEFRYSRRQRSPALQKAAGERIARKITAEQYEKVVQKELPVGLITNAKPETIERVRMGLSADKKAKAGVPSKTLKRGDRVQLRLDIPSLDSHGVRTITVHEGKSSFRAGSVIGYEPVASVALDRSAQTLGFSKTETERIAQGAAKAPIGTINGTWIPITPEEAMRVYEQSKRPNSGWVQVGMDPERHQFAFDRANMNPVVSGDRVVQIGNLVLVENPRYGSKEDFSFSRPDRSRSNAQERNSELRAQTVGIPQQLYAKIRSVTGSPLSVGSRMHWYFRRMTNRYARMYAISRAVGTQRIYGKRAQSADATLEDVVATMPGRNAQHKKFLYEEKFQELASLMNKGQIVVDGNQRGRPSLNRFMQAIQQPYRKAVQMENAINDLVEEGMTEEEARMEMQAAREAHIDALKVALEQTEDPKEIEAIELEIRHLEEGRSFLSDEEAKAITDEALNGPAGEQYREILKIIEEVNNYTLDNLVKSGLRTKAWADNLRRRFGPHYTPFKDWPDSLSQASKHGERIPQKMFHMYEGRTTEARGTVEHLFSQSASVLHYAELNKARVALADALQSAMKVEKVRAISPKDVEEGKSLMPTVESASEVTQFFEPENNASVEPVKQEAMLFAKRRGTEPILYYRNGRPGWMVTTDPMLAEEILDSGIDTINAVSKLFSFVTRMRTKLLTQWVPDFLLGNFSRDLQAIREGAAIEYGEEFAKKYFGSRVPGAALKYWMRAYKTLAADIDTLDPQQQQMRREFDESGARVAWVANKSFTDLAEELNRISRNGDSVNWLKKIGKPIERQSDLFENATRFMMFSAMRSEGASMTRAAGAARRGTIDFTQRGTMAPLMNALYIFSSVNMTSIGRLISLMQRGTFGRPESAATGELMQPEGGRAARLGLAASSIGRQLVLGLFPRLLAYGYIAAMLADLVGGDDEETEQTRYSMLPPYQRTDYLNIGTGTDAFVTVPSPHGFRAVTGFGALLYNRQQDYMTEAEFSDNLSRLLFTAFSPFSGSTPLQALSPDVFKPLVESAENKNWFGAQVHPDLPPGVDEETSPAAYRAYEKTSGVAKATAEWLNSVTGGSRSEKGLIDVYPSTLEAYMNFFTGGVGNTAARIGKLPEKVLSSESKFGEDWTTNDIPLLRVLVKTVNREEWARRTYEARSKDARQALADEKEAKKLFTGATQNLQRAKESGDPERISEAQASYDKAIAEARELYTPRQTLRSQPTFRMPSGAMRSQTEAFTKFEREIDKLYGELKTAGSDAERKQIRQKITKLRTYFSLQMLNTQTAN